MKSWSKLILTIASLFALMATSAYAHPQWKGGMTGMMGGPGMMYGGYGGYGNCMMGNGPNSPQGMQQGKGRQGGGMGIGPMQSQLDTLEKQLKLNSKQQAKWDKFEQAIELQANSMLTHRQQMFDYFRDNPSLSLPKRLERHTQMMSERYASMTAYSGALTELYESLEPEQQQILDQNTFMGCF